MKQFFEQPVIDVINFTVVDIIATSDGDDENPESLGIKFI